MLNDGDTFSGCLTVQWIFLPTLFASVSTDQCKKTEATLSVECIKYAFLGT
jgi:hypothetical protein